MKNSRWLARGLILSIMLLVTGCIGQRRDDAAIAARAVTKVSQDARWSFEATPAWRDEFEGNGAPDAAKWGYDLGGDGWGNRELQTYTDRVDNAFVDDGVLTIAARKETTGTGDYTSARLVSKGKGDFLYGRFEIRAKLPPGKGTWPALWMLPSDSAYGGWPKSGEIDIMEHVGFDPGNIHVTAHTEAYYFKIDTQKTGTRVIDDAMSRFHVYRLDWTPDAIRGYVDDVRVLEFLNEGTGYKVWPFDKRFHLLMNIAVGGDWGGKQGIDAEAFPARMQVDYVRVYRLVDRGSVADGRDERPVHVRAD